MSFFERIFGLGEYSRPFANSTMNHTDKTVGELREMRDAEIAEVKSDYRAEVARINGQFTVGKTNMAQREKALYNARENMEELLDLIADHEVYSVLD